MSKLTDKQLKEVIKAVLFVSGDGVELIEFTDKFDRSLQEVKELIKQLQSELSEDNGLHLITYANKAQLSSNPNLSEYVASVLNPIREKALTKAAMQTLGIIAYKQPITRLEIEQVRGVSADYAVNVLLENKMIEVVGRKDVVGKPLLFGTTEEFLKRFDLEGLSNLPDHEELLEQITLLRTENQQKVSEELYKQHKISDDELETAIHKEQLTDEERQEKQEQEEKLDEKLKSIDKVIKGARQNTEALLDRGEEEVESKINDEGQISDLELNKIFEKVIKESQDDDATEELA